MSWNIFFYIWGYDGIFFGSCNHLGAIEVRCLLLVDITFFNGLD